MKFNWNAIGPTIQAIIIGAGVLSAVVTLMNKQDAMAMSVNKDFAAVIDKITVTNQRVDKLYDLLVYPNTLIGGRQ